MKATFDFLRCFMLIWLLMAAGVRYVNAQNRRAIDGQEKVNLTLDLSYAGNENPRQKLDLLLPKDRDSDKRLPVLAYIHGGAFKGGHKRGGHRHLMKYVASGNFAGITIGYRLSGEAIWPAQIHDCKAGIRWIRANVEKYGLDPDQILVWGHSAGGHLSSMVGTTGGVGSLEGDVGPNTTLSSRVHAVCNYFGPSDFLQMDAHRLPNGLVHDASKSPESLLVGGAIQGLQEIVATANPITYISPDDPPFLSIHGQKDPLVPAHQSMILHQALIRGGVSSELYLVKDGGHGGFKDPRVPELEAKFMESFRTSSKR
jgi:acetyl esterase/lipase